MLVRTALEPLEDRIILAFIYGSLAKQREKADSDVDLMVVRGVELDEILKHLSKVEKEIGRTVNPAVYSANEFEAKLASESHFVSSVSRGPKFFIGGDDEFRKMGGNQNSQSGTD